MEIENGRTAAISAAVDVSSASSTARKSQAVQFAALALSLALSMLTAGCSLCNTGRSRSAAYSRPQSYSSPHRTKGAKRPALEAYQLDSLAAAAPTKGRGPC